MTNPPESLRTLTDQEFLKLGAADRAYVRPAIYNGAQGFSLHGADGTPLAFRDTLETAFALARQNDLEPSAIH
jgi:hypothetical protein